MTFSHNLLYFPQFMIMYFADVGVWQFMKGHKRRLKKKATHWVDAPKIFIKCRDDIMSSWGRIKLY